MGHLLHLQQPVMALDMGWVLGNEARDGSRRDPDPDPYADLARDGSGDQGAQADLGLLFAVGKGKGKAEMAQHKPEMAATGGPAQCLLIPTVGTATRAAWKGVN